MADFSLVPIKQIKQERALQPRVEIHKETQEKYKLILLDGTDLDPVELAQYDDGSMHIYSGHTRLNAYKDAGRDLIPAKVFEVDALVAQLAAAGANAKNGRPLSPADVENVVTMLLNHPTVRAEGWTDGRIAAHVGTYRARVLRIRTHLEETEQIVPYQVRAQRGEQTYPISRPTVPADELEEPDDGAQYGQAPDQATSGTSHRPKAGATTGTPTPGQVVPTMAPLSISIAWSYQQGRDFPAGQVHRRNLTDMPDHIRQQLIADLVAAFGAEQILEDMGTT